LKRTDLAVSANAFGKVHRLFVFSGVLSSTRCQTASYAATCPIGASRWAMYFSKSSGSRSLTGRLRPQRLRQAHASRIVVGEGPRGDPARRHAILLRVPERVDDVGDCHLASGGARHAARVQVLLLGEVLVERGFRILDGPEEVERAFNLLAPSTGRVRVSGNSGYGFFGFFFPFGFRAGVGLS
jgi:hypothetical protein